MKVPRRVHWLLTPSLIDVIIVCEYVHNLRLEPERWLLSTVVAVFCLATFRALAIVIGALVGIWSGKLAEQLCDGVFYDCLNTWKRRILFWTSLFPVSYILDPVYDKFGL